jgi:hypothetical protein
MVEQLASQGWTTLKGGSGSPNAWTLPIPGAINSVPYSPLPFPQESKNILELSLHVACVAVGYYIAL